MVVEIGGKLAEDNPKNLVQSVAKAFAVLRAFDANLPELTISEIAARTALDRGTSFRLVHTLCALGYLAPVPRSKRYRLTLKCLELGYTPLARADLRRLSKPLLNEMIPDVADAASLGMLDGSDVVYVERAQIVVPQFTLDRRPGSRIGAYGSALGHALLACLPVEQQRTLLETSNRIRLSEKTLVDVDTILVRLAEVRARGHAISDGENAYGLRTVAAAILDTDGSPLGGVSLTIHAERMPMERFAERAVPEVKRIAHALTFANAQTNGALRAAR